jgi:hypothetical protein
MSVPKRIESEFDDGIVLPPMIWLTQEESWAEFDRRAREVAGVSGEEFIRRLNAGEYDNTPDDREHWDLIDLSSWANLGR